MPLEIELLSSGLYAVYDAGATYDVRSCECMFQLNEADADELLTFVDTTSRGLATTVMTLPSGCGFFPFGADKGDTGAWTVALEILQSPGIMPTPYLYFDVVLKIVNQLTHPAYSPPAQVSEGTLTIGTVTNVKFPQSWFKPENRLGVYQSLGMSGTAKYTDRGSYADAHDTNATFRCNESKAAAILAYLTGTARGTTFSLITADNQYAFGMRSGASNTYTVRLIDSDIVTAHNGYNDFNIDLAMSREAIV